MTKSFSRYVYVANIKFKRGGIFRCMIWGDNEQFAIDLSTYLDNPMYLTRRYEVLYVQNPYTAIPIETTNIVEIEILKITREELDNETYKFYR